MPRRRRSLPKVEAQESPEATSLVCPECHNVYAGPHTGEQFDPYGSDRPSYPYSQGICNSRTCIRSTTRKHQEYIRSLSANLGKEPQPDAFWRKRAKDYEQDLEKAVGHGRADWGIPSQGVNEDWGVREPNPNVNSGGALFEPLQPPIDFEASDE
jgi:hypothetical protein